MVGASGAGKTAVGRALANLLSRPFVDTDEIVELMTGKEVSEIFSGEGEDAFRRIEAEAVKQAASIEGAVISCGGGAVVDPVNADRLRSAGTVFYLKVSPRVAVARIGGGEGRPLLAGKDVEARLEELINERAAAYEAAADHVIEADGDLEEVTGLIAALAQREEG